MPKISVGESGTVALFSGSEKVWIGVGEEYKDFPSKIFCLTIRKSFVGEFFTVAIIAGTEKIWMGGGVSRFYVENFVSHSAENFPRRIFYCSIIFRWRKNLDRRGSIDIFRRKIYVSQCRKNP